VRILLPRALADTNGGDRELDVEPPAGTLRAVFDAVSVTHPRLHRRIRDEAGSVRRYVNVYVDGVDIRGSAGLDTTVTDGATIHVLPSVAGG
jgi:molybdopterin converting factor small subunit